MGFTGTDFAKAGMLQSITINAAKTDAVTNELMRLINATSFVWRFPMKDRF